MGDCFTNNPRTNINNTNMNRTKNGTCKTCAPVPLVAPRTMIGNVGVVPRSCNVTNKMVGQSVTLEAVPGNGPAGTIYNIKFYKQVGSGTIVMIGEYNNVGTQTMIYTFVTADIGSDTFYSTASYTCSDGTVKSATSSSCAITVNDVCNDPTIGFNVY